MVEFKDRLKELRKEKGLSQQGLADVLSKTKTAIHMYENGSMFPRTAVAYFKYEKGQREPNNDTLVGIAQFFDVTTDYLLGLSDERKPKVIEKQLDLSIIPTDELMREVVRRWSQ